MAYGSTGLVSSGAYKRDLGVDQERAAICVSGGVVARIQSAFAMRLSDQISERWKFVIYQGFLFLVEFS